MFMLISENRCPTCGIVGKKWKKFPEVFICPDCNAFFNEFGIILESQKEKEMSFS